MSLPRDTTDGITCLRLILGDQLNRHHSWFGTTSSDVLYVMMEVRSETDHVRHHAQKVIGVFSAMRAYARELADAGHRVHYIAISDPDNTHDFFTNLQQLCPAGLSHIQYQSPDDYRLYSSFPEGMRELADWLAEHAEQIATNDSHPDASQHDASHPDASQPGAASSPALPRITEVSSEHFLADDSDYTELMRGDKHPVMEKFYRRMRLTTGILMHNDKPIGGQWNYDKDNRNPPTKDLDPPAYPLPTRDESVLWQEIQTAGIATFGSPNHSAYPWPQNRDSALALLTHFTNERLAQFGTYQDAMTSEHQQLYHSLLSFALNTHMLHPREVIDAAITAARAAAGATAPASTPLADNHRLLASLEGFVRQILGWREFMRQYYRHSMPQLLEQNALQAQRPLPSWYWSGTTGMNCLHQAITQSLETAYAHHIQRLMITGNFALLAGIHPDAVDDWYHGIYIDAFHWVEAPNTRGMSQYADGGKLATKPYAASARYINKMSDYCSGCRYAHNQRHGPDACPFNSLYWHFIHRNRQRLQHNHRMAMPLRVFDRFDPQEQTAILQQAEQYLQDIETL